MIRSHASSTFPEECLSTVASWPTVQALSSFLFLLLLLLPLMSTWKMSTIDDRASSKVGNVLVADAVAAAMIVSRYVWKVFWTTTKLTSIVLSIGMRVVGL
jgi:hypothetical protein